MAEEDEDTLLSRLQQALPRGADLKYHHISTPPTRCAALYLPPSHTPSQKTFCESHSLLVTAPSEHVTIYAIEIQIYTTASLTTIFVSKADSTGYASSVKIPSLIQTITTTFVSWLVRHRHRSDRRLVLSLFARAQNQYLFPGSIDNGKKHVLDDRQLVKWWCKTLDPVLREYSLRGDSMEKERPSMSSVAHLIVPGHDRMETTRFFPSSARNDPPHAQRWSTDSPLQKLTPYPTAPPRSQVPHFPDDPKARFLNELDDEVADLPQPSGHAKESHASPSKRGKGQWKSVKTLDQFWELMAFRQECSSGRLVGFLWMIFTPDTITASTVQKAESSKSSKLFLRELKTPADTPATTSTQAKPRRTHHKLPLTGPIITRPPRAKSNNTTSATTDKIRWHTRYFSIPPYTRGTIILPQKQYDRVHEILLRLDFSTLDLSVQSTKKWIAETAVVAGLKDKDWGISIEGERDDAAPRGKEGGENAGAAQSLSTLGNGTIPAPAPNVMLVRKKAKPQVATSASEAAPMNGIATQTGPAADGVVNTLDPSLIWKKRAEEAEPVKGGRGNGDNPHSNGVNVLGAGLVRKKPKPA